MRAVPVPLPALWLWLLLCLMTAMPLAGATTALTVQLKESVELAASRATLADVATLSGDPDLIALAGPMVVQQLHDCAPYRVSAVKVRGALSSLISSRRVRIDGETSVRRLADQYTVDQVADAARQHLADWIGDSVVSTISIKRISGGLQTPALSDQPTSLVAEALVDDPWGEVPYRIRLLRGERELNRALVVLTSEVIREVPVAAHDLPRDHTIQLQDLRLQQQRLADDAAAEPVTIETLVGRVTRTTVPANEPVTLVRTRLPVLVPGGSQVTLRFDHPRFSISVIGTALSAGSAGDVIRIRQPNGRAVRAQVVAAGEAVVNYSE